MHHNSAVVVSEILAAGMCPMKLRKKRASTDGIWGTSEIYVL